MRRGLDLYLEMGSGREMGREMRRKMNREVRGNSSLLCQRLHQISICDRCVQIVFLTYFLKTVFLGASSVVKRRSS